MSSAKPTRQQSDLAEVLELVLDKGLVINADIAITVGDTEMIGIELRAAIASFETAAAYGLAFPSGTDMDKVEAAAGSDSIETADDKPIDLGIDASEGGESLEGSHPSSRPDPSGSTEALDDEDDQSEEDA